MDTRKTCFVVMPFSDSTPEHTEAYWTAHFSAFLKPLIESSGTWIARRSSVLRGNIIRELVNDLVTAPVVVVDLTDANANVYWELGVRQSFRHGTITVAEFGTKIPFDIGIKATLFYHPKNHVKMEEFRSSFVRALQHCLDEPNQLDSHVLETLSGRGSVFELLQRDEAIRRLEALQSELLHNQRQLISIKQTLAERKRAGGKDEVHTTLLRRECCGLLMTTRYVNGDKTFYEIVETAFTGISNLNNQLALWESTPNTTVTWLENVLPLNESRLSKLELGVQQALEALVQYK